MSLSITGANAAVTLAAPESQRESTKHPSKVTVPDLKLAVSVDSNELAARSQETLRAMALVDVIPK